MIDIRLLMISIARTIRDDSLTVIEAINAIGKDKIDDSVRERIRRKLTKEELKIVKKEASTSRNWIYEEIIKL